jgi:Ser/Thr protein kinase RdoA (MazF antagonist)
MTNSIQIETVKLVLNQFRYEGTLVSIKVCSQGHINDSFVITTTIRKYFLQRISPVAFHKPKQVMSNIVNVTSFLKKKIALNGGNQSEECLTLIKTKEDTFFFEDKDGNIWRLMLFISGVVYDKPKNEEVFRKAGEGFGHFQYLLKDFPSSLLYEVIPHFHDTPKRYEALLQAIKGDKAGRVKDVTEEISKATIRRGNLDLIVKGLSDGSLPQRVTHNDTKLNNLMFDEKGEEPKCVLDLDTVMVGSPLYDFGDSIRSGASLANEDEKDVSKVIFSLPLFEAYAKGFYEGGHGTFTNQEVSLFPYSAMLMTYESAIRFLTDYLNGDTYFHIDYPTHNLIRAKNQFALLTSMEAQKKEMDEFVSSLTKN